MQTRYLPLGLLILVCFFSACKKDEYVGKDPYANAKEQLLIKLSTTSFSPASGSTGTIVGLTGTGFLKYKDSIRIKFNGELSDDIKVTDTTIQAKVPATASSGMITLFVGKQVFAGPLFTVNGPVKTDKTFQSFIGANNPINSIIQLDDGRYAIAGNFTDYNNTGVRAGYSSLAIIAPDGTLDKTFKIAPGFNGRLNQVIQLKSGQLLTGGEFSRFANSRAMFGNIALLNKTGALNAQVVNYTNRNGDPAKDTIPAFNAYFDGSVEGFHQQEDGRIIVRGSFRYYMSKTYYPESRDTVITDSVRVNGLVRLLPDGKLDLDYNYDPVKHQVMEGVDGFVNDSYLQPDGKLVLAGNFAKYKGQSIVNIARINPDGSLDGSFTGGGNMNGVIYSLLPMPDNKLLIVGTFSQAGGKIRKKLAVLKEDGSVDESFDAGAGADGFVNKAARLGDGRILVTGNFQTFNGMARYGFVILEPDGKFSLTNNNMGGFSFKDAFFMSPVNAILTIDQHNTLIVGNFNKIDLQQHTRIVKISY